MLDPKEFKNDLIRFLHTLEEPERKVLAALIRSGLETAEEFTLKRLSKQCGMSYGTFLRILHNSLPKLKGFLAAQGYEAYV
jgi:hypothetical protein